MRVLRHRHVHCRRQGRALFAVAVVVLTMPPGRIGSQDLTAPAAGPTPGRTGFRAHFIASPFGTIHEATFRFSLPIGTDVPAGAGLDLAADAADGEEREAGPRRESPSIDRSLKGARLVPRVRLDFTSPLPSIIDGATPPLRAAGPPSAAGGDIDEAAATDRTEATAPDLADPDPYVREPEPDEDGAAIRVARVYFATAAQSGMPLVALEPWPGEAPPFAPPKLAGAAPDAAAPSAPPHNATIAPKGEVTGKEHQPKSPAERLGLTGAARARHEKCLANAVYFEARGEPLRGQMAVAQVVINRVFSGYYPGNVCGVVYQNAHRRLRCQFTFACDGIRERINEPDAWERAKRIARDALDGSFWLNDVGKATHYHARWVHPWWVREMHRLDRIGVHTFYRPRKWGNGAGSPVWGDAHAKL
jgi:spore germination cell wall hydrolase CwlJ-like protein